MKIINNSENAICHGIPTPEKKGFYRVEVGGIIDVPEDIAKLWLKIKGVEEYAKPEDVKKAEEENADLKAKIKELEEKLKEKQPKKTAAKKPAAKKAKK